MAAFRLCSIPDCGKPHVARGWCGSHHQRWRKHGDPLGGGKPRIPRGEARRYYYGTVLSYDGDECLTWPYSTNNGYGQINLNGRPQIVSRLVCEAVHGQPPEQGWHAAHSCGRGDKGCVAKRHLSWKSPTDNEADKHKHGTYYARRGGAKLTVDDVRQIRSLAGTMFHRKIAERFRVDRGTVSTIIRNETWREGSI